MSIGVFEFMLVTIVPGILCYRLCGYRERASLPVPNFGVLKAAWQAKRVYVKEKARALETELTQQVSSEPKRRKRARLLAEKCYQALGCCDYLRAHAAATCCLEQDGKCVEGITALGIAAAAFGQSQQVIGSLHSLQRSTRFMRPSAAWAGAWIFVLSGNWDHAEALLYEAHKGRLREPTLLALLALCQARRGKLQSAIFNARLACNPQPPNKEYAKLLISLLLDAGLLREAQERLDKLAPEPPTHTPLMFSMLRFHPLLPKIHA